MKSEIHAKLKLRIFCFFNVSSKYDHITFFIDFFSKISRFFSSNEKLNQNSSSIKNDFFGQQNETYAYFFIFLSERLDFLDYITVFHIFMQHLLFNCIKIT